jgi:hypothetical protein
MKIKLQARNLWEAIEPGDVTLQEDRMVLDAITSTVPQEMLASLAVKATAAEAWEAGCGRWRTVPWRMTHYHHLA